MIGICYTEASGPWCGNQIKEEKEDCDCGYCPDGEDCCTCCTGQNRQNNKSGACGLKDGE